MMLTAGVPAFDEKNQTIWNACFRWNGRQVFRHSSDGVGWLLLDKDLPNVSSTQGVSSTNVSDRNFAEWSPVESDRLHTATDSPCVWHRFSNDRTCHQLLVQLGPLHCVDDLTHRWGTPPTEVVDDWKQQLTELGHHSLIEELDDENRLSQMAHVLASRDGTLISLDELESAAIKRVASQIPASIAATIAAPLASPILGKLSKTPIVGSKKRASKSQKLFSRRWPWIIGGGSAISIAVLCFTVWPRLLNDSSVDDQLVKNEAELNSAPRGKDDPDSPISIGIAPETRESLEPMELTVNEFEPATENLATQASTSIDSLMASLGATSDGDSIDAAMLSSVEKMLSENSEANVIQASLAQATESSLDPDMMQTSTPFPESLETNENPGMAEKSAEDEPDHELAARVDSELQPQKLGTEGCTRTTLTFSKTLAKSQISVPFRPAEKRAVCRARLVVPESLNVNPEGEIFAAGRQDVSWTVAAEDDTVSLTVYLRSKPSRSWYIATSVRTKTEQGGEMSVGPAEAQQVCQRLAAYLRWLDQQRNTLESLKSQTKFRSMASESIRAIDKQIKQSEKTLEQWKEIFSLVQVFFKSGKLELDLAASPDDLNDRKESDLNAAQKPSEE